MNNYFNNADLGIRDEVHIRSGNNIFLVMGEAGYKGVVPAGRSRGSGSHMQCCIIMYFLANGLLYSSLRVTDLKDSGRVGYSAIVGVVDNHNAELLREMSLYNRISH